MQTLHTRRQELSCIPAQTRPHVVVSMDYISGSLNHPRNGASRKSHDRQVREDSYSSHTMDDAWVQHVTSILDYLNDRTQSPNAQTCQSARDLMASLDAWSFLGSASLYGLQIRALEILQRLAYHDADLGSIGDIASWVLERWLRILQRHPNSVQALRGS